MRDGWTQSLIAALRVIDLKRDQVDLAIRHGKGAWRGLDTTFPLEEPAMPFCAPRMTPDEVRLIKGWDRE